MDKIVLQGTKDYCDERGNRVIGELPENVKITFFGENSTLEVGDNFNARGEGSRIMMHSGCKITIGDNVTLGEWFTFNTYDKGTIEIGSNCRFADGAFLSAFSEAVISFGDGSTMEQGNSMLALPYTEIRFGRDVMLSRRIFLQSNDGHAIYDVHTGENINSTEEISRKRKIIIGDHVWIGQSAILLYNTDIGSGSIVGAGALVKGKFPNNCSIGGVPAKVLKRDIAWSRRPEDDFYALPEEWRAVTELL